MGVRNHVASLMMKIEKDTNNLSKQEKKIANEYLDRIRKELQDMYDIMKQVENLYDNFYEQIGKSKNQRLKDKIEKINDAFQKQVEE